MIREHRYVLNARKIKYFDYCMYLLLGMSRKSVEAVLTQFLSKLIDTYLISNILHTIPIQLHVWYTNFNECVLTLNNIMVDMSNCTWVLLT